MTPTGPLDGSGSDAGVDSNAPNVDAGPPNPFTSIASMPGICSSDGWCWRWPTPTGNDLEGVFATDPNNVWIIGWDLVLQWDGAKWTAHQPPVLPYQETAQLVFSIGGSSPTNMWLTYGSALEHWDGQTWTIVESMPVTGNPAYNTLWVAPDTGDVWVTTSNGNIEQFHGTTKVNTFGGPTSFLGKIWGTSSTDMYVTTIGAEYHFDGAGHWTTINSSATLAGWQGAPNDVWVSSLGAIGHWDGKTFTMPTLPAAVSDPSQNIIAAGYPAANDVWWYASGGANSFIHWDGKQFTVTPAVFTDDSGFSPESVKIIGGTWWMSGRSGALYTSTDAKTVAPVLAPDWTETWSLWATSDSDLYITRYHSLLHWDGTVMAEVGPMSTILGVSPNTSIQLWGMTGRAGAAGPVDDELYLNARVQTGGSGANATFADVALHFDGTTWQKQTIDTGTSDQILGLGVISVVGPGEAWAYNSGGTSWHFTGGTWSPVATTANDAGAFTSVWAPDSTHAWIVGPNRTLVTWNAASPSVFTPVAIPPSQCQVANEVQELGQVIGVGGYPWIPSSESCQGVSAMWELGDGGWTEVTNEVLPDGDAGVYWINPETEGASDMGGLVAVGPNNLLYANGGDHGMRRFDGRVWKFEESGSQYPTATMTVTPSGETFAAVSTGNGILSHP
jgi:hypothetical protein